MSELVSMNVSPELVKPIVETKIREAITAALGGSENIVATVIDRIMTQKVNEQGNVGSYPSDNKYTWLEASVGNQLKTHIREIIEQEVKNSASFIRTEVQKYLQSKKGSGNFAELICNSMANSISNQYSTKINVEFTKSSRD